MRGKVRDALNFHLKPHPLVVVQAAAAPPGWNPRFSATARLYRYVILNRRSGPGWTAGSGTCRSRSTPARWPSGAGLLLGHHDFSAFRAASCQAKSPLRTLDKLEVVREGDRILVRAEARSFLHHQVRNMVGTLKLVGEGKWTPAQVRRRARGPRPPRRRSDRAAGRADLDGRPLPRGPLHASNRGPNASASVPALTITTSSAARHRESASPCRARNQCSHRL